MREWTVLFDEFGALGSQLYEPRGEVVGFALAPETIGTIFFHRIWGHFRSFALLWREKLSLDADVVLRNCCEAAICLANLQIRREAFIADLRADAANTLKSQIKIWRRLGDSGDLVKTGERHLAEIFGNPENGGAYKKLELEKLAAAAGLDPLYDYYRTNSAASAHISGLSILFHMVEDGSEEALAIHKSRRERARQQAIAHMCVVMGVGTLSYADLLNLEQEASTAKQLATRAREIGERYPDDGD